MRYFPPLQQPLRLNHVFLPAFDELGDLEDIRDAEKRLLLEVASTPVLFLESDFHEMCRHLGLDLVNFRKRSLFDGQEEGCMDTEMQVSGYVRLIDNFYDQRRQADVEKAVDDTVATVAQRLQMDGAAVWLLEQENRILEERNIESYYSRAEGRYGLLELSRAYTQSSLRFLFTLRARWSWPYASA